MINFSVLSEDEYVKICSVIPHDIITGYFRRYPEEFQKICKGFRASAVKNKEAINLLIAFKDRSFISSFVERIVKKWITEIMEVVDGYKNDGESELTAYIHTLYQSFFADNVSAFFKLIEKEYDNDKLNIITNLVSLLKEIDNNQREWENVAKKAKDELNSSEKKNNRVLEKANKQIDDLTLRLEKLQLLDKQFGELTEEYNILKNTNTVQKKNLEGLRTQISQLKVSIKELQKQNEEMEVTIRKKINNEQEVAAISACFSNPIRPTDLTEFQEYLSYNLESIGVKNNPLPISDLLSVYMANILFQGRPVVCNKSYVDVLTKCISNTLIGKTSIDTVVFSVEFDEKKITKTILSCGRIVVLDNFIGNFNESLLISLLNRFKNKILILTVTYDGTLRYITKEFFAYCNYVNLSSIPVFSSSINPDEDPSILEEEEYIFSETTKNNRFQLQLNRIMTELGYSKIIVNITSLNVSNDLSLCGYLIFNIVPFWIDVNLKNPFNYSEALQRYVNKCPYKSIFEEWFLK